MNDDDLFGPTEMKPKGRKANGKATGPPSPVPGLVAQYRDTFVARFGFEPKKSDLPRVAKICKDMSESWGAEAAARVIARFFQTRDPRVAGSDYSAAVLYREAQRLRMAEAGSEPKQLDARTEQNLREVRKATGR